MSVAVIRGVIGQIRWGYFNAAAIDGYTVTRTGPKQRPIWTLGGRVAISDAYKMRQRPLVFVALHERGDWTWPIVRFEIAGDRIRADLGPPEEHDVTIRRA